MAVNARIWRPIDYAIRQIVITDIAESGLSNSKIARTTERTEGWIRRIKAGTSAPLTVGEVEAIARVCGTTLADVLAQASEMVADSS